MAVLIISALAALFGLWCIVISLKILFDTVAKITRILVTISDQLVLFTKELDRQAQLIDQYKEEVEAWTRR